MKFQIRRVSLHQTAKVMTLVMTLSSLVFLIPFMLFSMAFAPAGAPIPWAMLLFMPVFYLVLGYIGTLISGFIYNTLAAKLGGVEYFATVTRTQAPNSNA